MISVRKKKYSDEYPHSSCYIHNFNHYILRFSSEYNIISRTSEHYSINGGTLFSFFCPCLTISRIS